MRLNNGTSITGTILTLIAIVNGFLACIISSIVFLIIIWHQYKDQMKRQDRITLILCANIYIMIIIYIPTMISLNIHTLLGDLYGQDFNTSWCTFRGYFICVMFCALYYGFVGQAFYRLCRIVYSSYRWIQLFWSYILMVPIHVAVACIFLCPILIWHEIIYLPNEHYCLASLTSIRSALWVGMNTYGIPLIYLLITYIRIIIFIRQQSNDQITARVKRRQERDLVVIKRIFILLSILIVLGIPSIVVLIIQAINGVEHPLFYRITWFTTALSVALLSVGMVLMTPQLKNIIMKKWKNNRVETINARIGESVQMETNVTME